MWMITSAKPADEASGLVSSMKAPKFHRAIADAKEAKARFNRLPGLRRSDSPARVTLRTNATSGRRLCGLNHIPLGLVERKVDFVSLAHGIDLVLQDAEHDHIPVPRPVEAGL